MKKLAIVLAIILLIGVPYPAHTAFGTVTPAMHPIHFWKITAPPYMPILIGLSDIFRYGMMCLTAGSHHSAPLTQ